MNLTKANLTKKLMNFSGRSFNEQRENIYADGHNDLGSIDKVAMTTPLTRVYNSLSYQVKNHPAAVVASC